MKIQIFSNVVFPQKITSLRVSIICLACLDLGLVFYEIGKKIFNILDTLTLVNVLSSSPVADEKM